MPEFSVGDYVRLRPGHMPPGDRLVYSRLYKVVEIGYMSDGVTGLTLYDEIRGHATGAWRADRFEYAVLPQEEEREQEMPHLTHAFEAGMIVVVNPASTRTLPTELVRGRVYEVLEVDTRENPGEDRLTLRDLVDGEPVEGRWRAERFIRYHPCRTGVAVPPAPQPAPPPDPTFEERFSQTNCGWCGTVFGKICFRCKRAKSGARPAHGACDQRCKCVECDGCKQTLSVPSLNGEVCAVCHKHKGCAIEASKCVCILCTCGRTAQGPDDKPCTGFPEMNYRGCGRLKCCCSCDVHGRFLNSPIDTLKLHVPKLGQSIINPVTRLIGVEIEVDQLRTIPKPQVYELYKTVKKWKGGIVRDGSVANGYEINTAPAGGDLFVSQLTEISDIIRAGPSRASRACGYHVHVDARDFGWWDIRKLVVLYTRIEGGLFQLLPPHRRTSTYCRPCAHMYTGLLENGLLGPELSKSEKKEVLRGPKAALLDALYGQDGGMEIPGFVRSKHGTDNRYNALNLHSWMHRGTIEFRHHHGVTEKTKLINWAILCAAILDTANREREEVLNTWPVGVPGLVQIAPTLALKDWVVDRAKRFGDARRKTPRDERNYIHESDSTGAIERNY